MIDSLTIHLLGTPEARLAGTPLTLHHQKARALLYYLAATGRPFTRDHLASLLWSETPENNARHSLRSSLYHMRQALHAQGADEALVGDGDMISLRLNDDACDVLTFRRLFAQNSEQALARAVTLYHGPFLQGFTVTDAPLFEEWLRFEQDELAQVYLTMSQRLASWAEQRQDWSEVIANLQRIVQVEPLSEEIQQRLMQAYLRTGAIGQALRQYHQFEAELKHELDLTPSLETQALFSSALLMRQNPPTQSEKVSRTPDLHQRALRELPFVGRDEVFHQLAAISKQVSAGRGCAVLIQGEDGVGRSRLLYELASVLEANQPRWMILQGSCSPFDDLLSYGPFLEAFQQANLGDLLSQARDIDASEQQRFQWVFLQALQTLTRGAPLLLSIDDLQWANSQTLHLFGFLATRLRALPVLLVGTVQRAEAIPALQRLVTLGRRHGDVHTLSLLPLTIEDVRTVTTNLGIGSAPDTWTSETISEWLYERSGGNPFLISEIMAQLQADGILSTFEGRMRLDVGRWRRWRATFNLPETTHDLVAWRLTNLSPQARALLDVLAVANLPLPFILLREFPGLSGADPSQSAGEQLLATVEDLVARGLVVETGHELLTLPHNLLCETLQHQLSRLRRVEIHRQLAKIIEHCPVLQAHFPLRQLALHAVAGEDFERARRYGLQILDELVQDNANAQTAVFLRHLHDLLAQADAPYDRLRLTLALGKVHQSLGRLEEAGDWHRQHLDLARQVGDLSASAAGHYELGELALVANDYQAAGSEARTGLAVELPADHPQRLALTARGYWLLGAALAMEGNDLPSAQHYLLEAIDIHRLTDNVSDLCATLFELGNVAAQGGELEHALERYQEAERIAELAHVHYIHALANNNFAYHSLLLGRPHDARQALTAGTKLAERHELFGALMHLSSTQGELHLYLGEWRAAEEAFQNSLALAEELRNLERQAGNRAGLALAARGQGDIESTLKLLEEALQLITERGFWHLRTRIQLWLAETLLPDSQAHRTEQAAHYLEAALATARTHARQLLLLQGERLQARLLATREEGPAAQALFAQALDRATDLHLPLETARTKAAWGQSLLRYAPREGQRLLSEARQELAAHGAQADLHTIEGAVRV
ncbi:MAG TPA: AAA family ATPase [Ktedonobacteraceae bacterium]|nr:AAA family ATPase [Ktedonobacteraceae bacterium]